MHLPRIAPWLCAFLVASALGACKKSESDDAPEEQQPPRLSDLALPVSLRTGDAPPRDPLTLEASTEALRLGDEVLLSLERGRFAEADRNDGTLPALRSALASGAGRGLALRLAANLPYESVALTLHTAAEAGVREAALQVRKTGQNQESGWITLRNFVTASRAQELPEIPGVTYRDWDEFAEKWDEIRQGCQSGRTANCAHRGASVAEGGQLRMELMTKGRSVNVNFFRRALSEEAEAEAKRKRAAKLARMKEDFFQGRISEEELVEETLKGDPSTYARFQFRYQEALEDPSALGKTISPLCSDQKCGMVVRASNTTPFVRVASMLGAAFPDGTQLPSLAFELPWTEKAPPEDLKAFIEEQKALQH